MSSWLRDPMLWMLFGLTAIGLGIDIYLIYFLMSY